MGIRVRIVNRPSQKWIDGIHIEHFEPGEIHDLPSELAGVFLVEGWAEPVLEARGVERADDRPLRPLKGIRFDVDES